MQRMSTPRENSEEVEVLFLHNKQDNNIITVLLSQLQDYQDASEYTQYASLITVLQLYLEKQKLENNNKTKVRE